MADFAIDTYRRDYLEGMTALFNAETAFEPYVAPLDPDRFIALVESKSYFDPAGVLVARRGGQVVGWVHACVAAGSEGHHDPSNRVPRIRMLMFPRHELKVGNTLTREAIGWLKQTGQTRILALHAQVGYPFYRGLWFGGEPMGPTTIPHMQMALEVNGFDNTQESIFITKALDGPPQPAAATVALEFVEAAAELRHEPMRESWIGFTPMRTRAYSGDEEVGSISWVIIPYLDRLGAPCMNIWGLGVRDQHRRKGIASALIAHALISAYGQGARYASVGTQLWNAPAHATYVGMGFRPHGILVGRTLDLTDEKPNR
jgi:GNAT superfamily N-acetyltransferase